jgi:hypothetical protein
MRIRPDERRADLLVVVEGVDVAEFGELPIREPTSRFVGRSRARAVHGPSASTGEKETARHAWHTLIIRETVDGSYRV